MTGFEGRLRLNHERTTRAITQISAMLPIAMNTQIIGLILSIADCDPVELESGDVVTELHEYELAYL